MWSFIFMFWGEGGRLQIPFLTDNLSFRPRGKVYCLPWLMSPTCPGLSLSQEDCLPWLWAQVGLVKWQGMSTHQWATHTTPLGPQPAPRSSRDLVNSLNHGVLNGTVHWTKENEQTPQAAAATAKYKLRRHKQAWCLALPEPPPPQVVMVLN